MPWKERGAEVGSLEAVTHWRLQAEAEELAQAKIEGFSVPSLTPGERRSAVSVVAADWAGEPVRVRRSPLIRVSEVGAVTTNALAEAEEVG